jgi:peptide-methionine (R)-S-oxide reductase
MVNRRNLTLAGAAGLVTAAVTALTRSGSDKALAAGANFEVTKTDEEWRKILSREAYEVLRQHGTERAGSSALDKQYGAGTYACAGCDVPLFSSQTKFNSGTGWPSFYAPLENAVATTTDRSWGMKRVEVHCHRCGGHLGHVFDDGPPPTGKRYCMNGVAMKFVAESKTSS